MLSTRSKRARHTNNKIESYLGKAISAYTINIKFIHFVHTCRDKHLYIDTYKSYKKPSKNAYLTRFTLTHLLPSWACCWWAWQPSSLSWGAGSSRPLYPAPGIAASGATGASPPRACSRMGHGPVAPCLWGYDWPATGWGGIAATWRAFWWGWRGHWMKGWVGWWRKLWPWIFSLYWQTSCLPLKKKRKINPLIFFFQINCTHHHFCFKN